MHVYFLKGVSEHPSIAFLSMRLTKKNCTKYSRFPAQLPTYKAVLFTEILLLEVLKRNDLGENFQRHPKIRS